MSKLGEIEKKCWRLTGTTKLHVETRRIWLRGRFLSRDRNWGDSTSKTHRMFSTNTARPSSWTFFWVREHWTDTSFVDNILSKTDIDIVLIAMI